MRRIFSTLLLIGCALPMALLARAEAVTPAEARACASDAEQMLIELNNCIADGYFHHGEFDKAVCALDRITVLSPIGVEPYATAAWLLWSSGKNDEALEFYHRMIAANPKDPEGYFEIGSFYVRLKNDEEAVRWLAQAVQLGLDTPKNHLYGICLARLGRTDEALAFWRSVLAAHPKDDIAQREIGRLTKKAPPAK